MKQTRAHDVANADLLALIPRDSTRVVEIGCSSGALGRAFLAINPSCEYIGIDIDPDYAQLAKASCSRSRMYGAIPCTGIVFPEVTQI